MWKRVRGARPKIWYFKVLSVWSMIWIYDLGHRGDLDLFDPDPDLSQPYGEARRRAGPGVSSVWSRILVQAYGPFWDLESCYRD